MLNVSEEHAASIFKVIVTCLQMETVCSLRYENLSSGKYPEGKREKHSFHCCDTSAAYSKYKIGLQHN
jgi:hypothetical protein